MKSTNSLLDKTLQSPKHDQSLIIEIISGYDIKCKKKWVPFVEVSQGLDSMPSSELNKINNLKASQACRNSSLMRSSKIDIDGYIMDQEDELRDNKVVFSTPINKIK